MDESFLVFFTEIDGEGASSGVGFANVEVIDGRAFVLSTRSLFSFKVIDLAGKVSARFEDDSPTIEPLFSNPILCRGVGLVGAVGFFPAFSCDNEFRPGLDINESLEEVRLTPDGCGGTRSSGLV